MDVSQCDCFGCGGLRKLYRALLLADVDLIEGGAAMKMIVLLTHIKNGRICEIAGKWADQVREQIAETGVEAAAASVLCDGGEGQPEKAEGTIEERLKREG